jgi:hypothetical protein
MLIQAILHGIVLHSLFIKPNVRRICWLFCMVKSFWFHIQDKEGFGKSRDISFRALEPCLAFLNIPQLERQGADIQSKVEELEALNQSRDSYKLKDDAIAHLITLTARLDSIEKRP